MAATGQFSQRSRKGAKFGAAVVCGLVLMTVPVVAQMGGGQGNFDSYFSPYSAPRRAPQVERSVDYSRAPSPRRPDSQPTGGNVLVLGDSMADWLAYGLEDALGDPPDLSVVRRNRASSGLIRYDGRNEREDWTQAIREAIAATKPKFIVMMIGLNDRVSIRDRVVQPAPPAPPAQAPKPPAQPAGAAPEQPAAASETKADAADAEQTPAEQSATITSEQQPKSGTVTFRIHEFRTDEWAATYSKRIDATIQALKSAGVPVFWVGLPSIRGPKSTSDMQYLNDLYRARVEKAAVSYIDVWDGFVDDSGRFTVQGPDFEGQIRQLRAGDGVHFTRAGARKLAHYLEREIRRVSAPGSEPVALPSSEPQAPATAAKPSGPAARPLAGPVVPLTASVTATQELIGSRDPGDPSIPKSVIRVLVNGEAVAPPAGRSDDFKWPRRTIAPVGTDPVVATTTEPIPVMKPAPETTVAAPKAEIRPVAAANPVPRRAATARAQPQVQPQPPQQPRNDSFFSFFR
ncbi:MAG: uncharacterized protein QOF91_417 [Alphaproteobacteria bacterium]|nr:uncharacterized protein [Alphaproteobacteria bacterium]